MTIEELKLIHYVLNNEPSEGDWNKAREIIKREIRLKTEDFRKASPYEFKHDITGKKIK